MSSRTMKAKAVKAVTRAIASTPSLGVPHGKKGRRRRAGRTPQSLASLNVPGHHANSRNRDSTRPLSHPTNSREASLAYKGTLTDPFNHPPVRLGWGAFTPTSLHTAWARAQYAVDGAHTCFAVCGSGVFASASVSTAEPAYLECFSSTTSGTLLSSGALVGSTAAFNHTALSSLIQTARVVSGGLRVTVRYPALTIRGRVFAGIVPAENWVNVVGSTFDKLTNLFAFKECYSTAEGELSCEVQYRPVDSTSFEFHSRWPSPTPGNSSLAPTLIVVGSGFQPGQFQVSASEIFHYETLSGFDGSGEDAGAPTLASLGVTSDVAAASVASISPVLINMTAIEMLDEGIQNIHRSTMRTGMGGFPGSGLARANELAPASSSGSPLRVVTEDDSLSGSVYLDRTSATALRTLLRP